MKWEEHWSIFVLMKQPWVSPWWGLVTRKTKPRLEAWNFQPCPPHAGLESGEGLEMEFIIDYACLRKPPQNPNSRRVTHPTPQGQKLYVQKLYFLYLNVLWEWLVCISSSGCFSVSFITSFRDKCFHKFYKLLYQIVKSGGDPGNLWSVARLDKKVVVTW